MILITAYEGRSLSSWCDSACYDAQDDECDCICNGRNHGVGLDQAVRFTRNGAAPIAREIKRRFPHVTRVCFHYQTSIRRFTFQCENHVNTRRERPAPTPGIERLDRGPWGI